MLQGLCPRVKEVSILGISLQTDRQTPKEIKLVATVFRIVSSTALDPDRQSIQAMASPWQLVAAVSTAVLDMCSLVDLVCQDADTVTFKQGQARVGSWQLSKPRCPMHLHWRQTDRQRASLWRLNQISRAAALPWPTKASVTAY